MNFDNQTVRNIVKDSDKVSEIMSDLLIQVPGLFKTTMYETVKGMVVDFIFNPKDIPTTNKATKKFKKVLKKHLERPKPPKKAKSESVRLATKLRTKLRAVIRGDDTDRDFIKILGCSPGKLRKHLEQQFLPGMTWDNYGLYGWHVDHIDPLCSYDLTNYEEVCHVSHYSNLRPLWASENLNKAKQDRKKSIRGKSKLERALQ